MSALVPTLEKLQVGEVRADVPLAPWTSVRVGGAAEILLRPSSLDGLIRVLGFARDEQIPITLLGGGANTLVGDGGVPGITLKLPSQLFPEQLERTSEGDGLRITLGAGAAISRLCVLMKSQAVVGAEFLAGIPGTLGGAVAMNAGTKHGECMRVVESVEVATPDGAAFLPRASLPHVYRHTHLPALGVVTRVRFLLPTGDTGASAAAMEKDLAYRKRTQPLSQPNFGSVFTNPPGHFAGELVERVGLKGQTLGKAQISTLHANWIVNLGGATARDVLGLMEMAQLRVREATGIGLEPEVKRVGRF